MNVADELHQRFGGGWHCKRHHATFEHHEAEENDGNCPWCGLPVEHFEDYC